MSCVNPNPQNTVTDRMNQLLSSGGNGYVLSLCPSQQYFITQPIAFAAPNQEISTQGYPTGNDRATLVVSGPVSNGQGHTNAVDGTCTNCSGVKLRNIQINGTRAGAPPTQGGANIEMGGGNTGQLIEYVHSFDPRSWSCLHIAEGPLTCSGAVIQYNDIGPCGSDTFQEWADGISLSCSNSIVRNNTISDPTDGGIVIFGAPGSLIQNNTIMVQNATCLGGINLVDYEPWLGNYTNTVVRDNMIYGGFATDVQDASTEPKGVNKEDAIIKIGIAVGPRTWFGDRYLKNVSFSGMVLSNHLTGAFGYAVAITSARNFTIQNNVLFGNTSFIGSRGPNCTTYDTTPTPQPFVVGYNNTDGLTLQSDFQQISDGDSLTCILPPDGGDYWPFGGNPGGGNNTTSGGGGSTPNSEGGSGKSGLSSGAKAGIAVGVILGLALIAAATYFIRKAALKRQQQAGGINQLSLRDDEDRWEGKRGSYPPS